MGLRHDEPSRPIDPSAWVAHTEALRSGTPSWSGVHPDVAQRSVPPCWPAGGNGMMQGDMPPGGGFYAGNPFSDMTSTASSSIISSVNGSEFGSYEFEMLIR